MKCKHILPCIKKAGAFAKICLFLGYVWRVIFAQLPGDIFVLNKVTGSAKKLKMKTLLATANKRPF